MSSPTAPAPLSSREQAFALVAGLWMIVGLFLDGIAHDENEVESFFTPWHAVLYSGFAAGAVAALAVPVARRGRGRWVDALPAGHGLTLLALVAFAGAAAGDLLWHETVGIEVGVEALLSPTHLALLTSGLVAMSAPLRAHWRRPEVDGLRATLPAVLDLALLAGVVGFFLVFLSPLVNEAGTTAFERAPGDVHEHPATDPDELLQLLGVGSILVSTLLVVVPVETLRARRRPPPGAIALLVTLVALGQVALDRFEHPLFLVAGVLAGAAMELAAPRVGDSLSSGLGVLVLWTAWFAGLAALGDLGWAAELWTGATVMAALLVGVVSRLVSARTGPTTVFATTTGGGEERAVPSGAPAPTGAP